MTWTTPEILAFYLFCFLRQSPEVQCIQCSISKVSWFRELSGEPNTTIAGGKTFKVWDLTQLKVTFLIRCSSFRGRVWEAPCWRRICCGPLTIFSGRTNLGLGWKVEKNAQETKQVSQDTKNLRNIDIGSEQTFRQTFFLRIILDLDLISAAKWKPLAARCFRCQRCCRLHARTKLQFLVWFGVFRGANSAKLFKDVSWIFMNVWFGLS